MKITNNRGLSAAVAACMLTTFLARADAAANAPIANAEEGWAAFTQCAAIAADKPRHTCFDNLSRTAGLVHSADTTPRKDFGLPPAEAKAREAVAQKENQLEVTLATVAKSADGKLTLSTTDGAVWRQVESDMNQPVPEQGQKMTIEKASLGSFRCKTAKWAAFRCLRIR